MKQVQNQFFSLTLCLKQFGYAINLLIILLLLKGSYFQFQFIKAKIIDFKTHLLWVDHVLSYLVHDSNHLFINSNYLFLIYIN